MAKRCRAARDVVAATDDDRQRNLAIEPLVVGEVDLHRGAAAKARAHLG